MRFFETVVVFAIVEAAVVCIISNPTTMDELKRTIEDIWCKDIDQNVCKNLTISMPSRIQNVIKNKGYHINTSATAII